MVETLEEILKKDKEKKTAEQIQLFLNKEETIFLLKKAESQLKKYAWVIKNISKYPPEKRSEIEERVKKNAKMWERIAMLIESQMG